MLDKLNNLVSSFEQKRKEFEKASKEALHDSLKEVFDAFPNVKAISWVQYAPYFNDGDACEFSVHEARAKVEGLVSSDGGNTVEEADEGTYIYDMLSSCDLSYESDKSLNMDTKALSAVLDKLTNLLQSMEDVLRGAFGSDSQVIVTRDKIEVEDFEHD